MLSAASKNGALVLILLLAVAVYFGRTVPADFRNRALRDSERKSIEEVERLRLEAERWQLQKEALEQRDPTTLSRIVTARMIQGRVGVQSSDSEEREATTPNVSGKASGKPSGSPAAPSSSGAPSSSSTTGAKARAATGR